MKLFDDNAPGVLVVTAVPITSEVCPRAMGAYRLAVLPPAPEALLAPVAQVLPGVRTSKRHAFPRGCVPTCVGLYPDGLVRPMADGPELPLRKYKDGQRTKSADLTFTVWGPARAELSKLLGFSPAGYGQALLRYRYRDSKPPDPGGI